MSAFFHGYPVSSN